MSEPAILVVDPEPGTAAALRAALQGHATVQGTSSLARGLELLGDVERWRAVILSLDLESADLAIARRVLESGHADALVLLSSRPTMQLSLETSRLGALGLFGTPVDAAAVAETLRPLLRPVERVVPLPAPDAAGGEDAALGSHPRMIQVFQLVGRVAASDAAVLVLGESGTGKELIARAIHRNSSRAEGPFVAVNCAAIPENLLESEMFGHEKGAFTGAVTRKTGRFERASGGTLFLDEIGDMSLPLQAKILRALQEQEIERVGSEQRIRVDLRVVAATNQDLRRAINEGAFRQDLYFRLGVVTLELPRLAERGADLDLLARHYASRYAARYGKPLVAIAESALARLRAHTWPGNVRELKNVIERAVLVATGEVLLAEHLPQEQLRAGATPGAAAPLPGYSAELSLAEVERLHIREVLRLAQGHMGRAAEILDIHRNTLTRKVRDYGLDDPASFS